MVSGKVLKKGGTKFFSKTSTHNHLQRGERVRRLTNSLIRNGKRYRPQRAVGEALSWLREFHCDGMAGFDHLERALFLLETGATLRIVMSRGKKATPTPYVVSSGRRVSFGIKFFVKGVRARIRNTHVSLTEAIFEEAVNVELGEGCYSATMRADHSAALLVAMVAFKRRSRRRPY